MTCRTLLPRPPPHDRKTYISRLLCRYEVRAAILLPTFFGVLGAERTFLAPADGVHAIGTDAQRNQIILGRLRAPFAQADIVFGGTPLIAMAFDGDADLRIGTQEFGGLGESVARIGANVGLIEIKVSVFHVLLEKFAHTLVGRGSNSGSPRANRDARGGRGGAARTSGSDGVSCGAGGVHRRRAVRGNFANARLDIRVGGVGGSQRKS